MTYAFALLLAAAAAASRIVPVENVNLVLPIALLGGAVLPRRLSWAVPLTALVASDLVINISGGWAFTWVDPVRYACFVGVALGGWWLGARRTWPRTLGTALAGAVVFFVVSNFAHWLVYYDTHTPATLARCYELALPFFRSSLVGDLAGTVVVFAIYDLARLWGKSRRAETDSEGVTL